MLENRNDSLLVSGGLQLEGERQLDSGWMLKTWLRGDVEYEFLAENEIEATDGVNTVTALSDMRGFSYKVTLGTTVELNETVALFANANARFGMTEEYGGKVGLRVRW